MAAAAAIAVAAPAFADIASFNAAVKAADFKKAAAEAAATWPQLDKSREDIALIAREFGFAAYLASDFAAARGYAEFAAGKAASDLDGAMSSILLRLSEHRLGPSNATRNKLHEALVARAEHPGSDPISYLGVDSLVVYDLEAGKWKDAGTSADLAVKLTTSAGQAYALQRRRFELSGAIAGYRVRETADGYRKFLSLSWAVYDDVVAARTDQEAERLAPLLWEINSWTIAVGSHLKSRGRSVPENEREDDDKAPTERAKRLLDAHDDDEPCKKSFASSAKPEYPASALYGGFVGAVVLRVDIDEAGRASNPTVLAAVPEKHFAEPVLDQVGLMRWVPGKAWDKAACSLAEKGHIVTFQFLL
jgi:hypothetical protein